MKVLPANLDNLTPAARAYGVTGGADNLEIGVPERAAEGAASLSGQQNKLALSTVRGGKRFALPLKGQLSDLVAKLPVAYLASGECVAGYFTEKMKRLPSCSST